MTRMTGPDCAVMCNLINTHTHMHTLQTGSGACGHRTAAFIRPGAFARALYRGGNQIRVVGRSERDGNRVGGDTNEDRAGTGMGTGAETRE